VELLLETSKSGNALNSNPEVDMLSAEEKIEELSTLLQQKTANLEKMEQDLLEVQVRHLFSLFSPRKPH
jgi:hypothetical protein